MAAPRIAPAALTQIRRLVVERKAQRPVVCVSWESEKVDNKRGPNGETLWHKVSDGHWNVFVVDYAHPHSAKLTDCPVTTAHGLEFADLFFDPRGRELQNPLLDYEGGAFVLREAAI